MYTEEDLLENHYYIGWNGKFYEVSVAETANGDSLIVSGNNIGFLIKEPVGIHAEFKKLMPHMPRPDSMRGFDNVIFATARPGVELLPSEISTILAYTKEPFRGW